MAGKIRYLIHRGDRLYARMVVPERLRSIIGKVELSEPLGADRREALRELPAVVSKFQKQLAAAKQQLGATVTERPRLKHARPLTIAQMARLRLSDGLAFDDELRDSDPRYASIGFVDEHAVRSLRNIRAGAAYDDEIQRTLGIYIEWFRRQKNHDYAVGSVEWRRLARSLALAELTVLDHTVHRDEGYPDPEIPPELLPVADPDPIEAPASSVRDIFAGYGSELAAAGKAADAAYRWAPIIEDLTAFLAHDNARLVTRRDVLRWKDHLLERHLSPKTVRDSYLSTVKAAFNWASDNELLDGNPAAGVKVRLTRKILSREKGLTDSEALAVLQAAVHYQKPRKEDERMAAAKRWAPLLCAFTGARIAEITQLRAQDVCRENDIVFVRITPEAGTVKTGQYRDVPLHPQVLALGFMDFVNAEKSGPLFYRETTRRGRAHPSRIVADRVAKWIRSLDVIDAIVQPNHGWRHRFKTQGRALGIETRILDCIQGHTATSASDNYGDVTLATKRSAIEKFPPYDVTSRNDADVGTRTG